MLVIRCFGTVLLLLTLGAIFSEASAQSIQPLTPFSRYDCVNLDSGAVLLARRGTNGRQFLSADQVRDEIGRRISSLKADKKALKALKKEIKVGSFSDKDLKTLKGMLKAALFEPLSDAIKLLEGKKTSYVTRQQKLAVISALLEENRLDTLGAEYERDALVSCVGGIVAADGVPVRLVPFNEYGNHWVVLILADVNHKRPKKGYAYSYCVKRDSVAFPIYFSKDPCSIVTPQVRYGSCPYAAWDQAGTVLSGIIGTSTQGSADNQADIDRLLISAYGTWGNKRVKLKTGGPTTDCYKLFD